MMSSRRLLLLPLAVLALAPAAQAQTPATPTTPVEPPAPKPVAGKATMSVHGGQATKKTRYYAPSQEVVVRRFLPLESEATIASAGDAEARAGFEFEPSAGSVLETLLPRYVESRLFAAMLDAAASELASRQRAMKSATDNAQELIVKLTRRMNQVRQDAITTEIMEIIGGAEALAEDRGSPEDLILDHTFSDPFPSRSGEHVRHTIGHDRY